MEDLRVRRTYLSLKNALFELLSKKSFEEIKVNDICNLAMIHRTTFYSHFQDKYELLEYCIKDIEQELTEKISNNVYNNSKEFYTNLVMNLLDYISENKKSFKSILKRNSDSGVTNVFIKICISFIKTMLEKEKDNGIIYNVDTDVISQFYAGAVMSTVVWWIISENQLSEKELCDSIITLIFDAIH